MWLKKIDYTEKRFELLVPRPLELIDCEKIWKLVKETSDWAYSCICPNSEKVIDVYPSWEVRCDVWQKWRKTCWTIWSENELCPYNAYIK